jgi:hypothetical protein
MITIVRVGMGGRLDEGELFADFRKTQDSSTKWICFPRDKLPRFKAPMSFDEICQFIDHTFQQNQITSFSRSTHFVTKMTNDIKDFSKGYNARPTTKPKNFNKCVIIDQQVGLATPHGEVSLVAISRETPDGTTGRIGGSTACTNTMVALAKSALLKLVDAEFRSGNPINTIQEKVPETFTQLFECFSGRGKIQRMINQAIEAAANRVMRAGDPIMNANQARER